MQPRWLILLAPLLGAGAVPRCFDMTLTVSGGGLVSWSDVETPCGDVCKTQFEDDKTVTFRPDPSEALVFVGWSGDCAGTAGNRLEATLVLRGRAAECTARFEDARQVLHLEIRGTGTVGMAYSVESGPVASCSATCDRAFQYGSLILLSSSRTSRTVEWGGDCATVSTLGGAPVLSMTRRFDCTATFTDDPGPGPNGDTCTSAIALSPGTSMNQSVASLTDDYRLGDGCGSDATTKDIVYRFDVPAGRRATISSDAPGAMIQIVTGGAASCSASPRRCAEEGRGMVSYTNAGNAAEEVLAIVETDSAAPFAVTLAIGSPSTPGETCANAEILVADGTPVVGTLAGYADDYIAPAACEMASFPGAKDRVYRVEVPAGQLLTVHLDPRAMDAGLMLFEAGATSCSPSPLRLRVHGHRRGNGGPRERAVRERRREREVDLRRGRGQLGGRRGRVRAARDAGCRCVDHARRHLRDGSARRRAEGVPREPHRPRQRSSRRAAVLHGLRDRGPGRRDDRVDPQRVASAVGAPRGPRADRGAPARDAGGDLRRTPPAPWSRVRGRGTCASSSRR